MLSQGWQAKVFRSACDMCNGAFAEQSGKGLFVPFICSRFVHTTFCSQGSKLDDLALDWWSSAILSAELAAFQWKFKHWRRDLRLNRWNRLNFCHISAFWRYHVQSVIAYVVMQAPYDLHILANLVKSTQKNLVSWNSKVLFVSSHGVCVMLNWLECREFWLQHQLLHSPYHSLIIFDQLPCFEQWPCAYPSGGEHSETGLDHLHQHPGGLLRLNVRHFWCGIGPNISKTLWYFMRLKICRDSNLPTLRSLAIGSICWRSWAHFPAACCVKFAQICPSLQRSSCDAVVGTHNVSPCLTGRHFSIFFPSTYQGHSNHSRPMYT